MARIYLDWSGERPELRPLAEQRLQRGEEGELLLAAKPLTADHRPVVESGGSGDQLATATRRAACPMFWTLGANQVGKGLIAGWRDCLQPALRDPGLTLRLWPFHGGLFDLLGPGRMVVAETYPGECYGHLGVAFPKPARGARTGKRVREGRLAVAPALTAWARAAGVVLSGKLRAEIGDGFGASADGEDRFDAVVGLCGMLNVVLGGRAPGDPTDPVARSVEGWILGQEQL